jgi:glycosyltransferase involved in cell wall biosynthesis
MMPKVAICIPTHNQAQYLSLSISSACNQTYPNTEVWVSDDASTDATPEVMAAMCKSFPNIFHYRQPQNLGMRDNPDWLMRKTNAEFIVRFDSDDILEPNYIETLVNLMLQYPESGYAHGAVREIDKEGNLRKIRRLARHQGYESAQQALRASVKGYRVAANICMYRAKALQDINFFGDAPSKIVAEDYHTSIRLADAGYGNVYCPKILASYRVWGGSQWTIEKQIAELQALIQIYDNTLIPAFHRRGWNTSPIYKHRLQRAIGAVGILKHYGFKTDEYQSVVYLLKEMGDSLYLRLHIKLIQLGLSSYLEQLTVIKQQFKDSIKQIFFER